jgi:hypothetical protein
MRLQTRRPFTNTFYGQAELRFLEGRIKFVDYTDPEKPTTKAGNVKPSMLVIFRAISVDA